MPLPAAMSHAGSVVLGGLLLLVLALALFAVVDVPLQRHQLSQTLKMSVQEMKQEQREVEGNAEVKSRQRSRMRELANRRMLAAVPGADLVVMNPSHFAVALKYQEGLMSAPKVVAKGMDLMALRIRDAAQGAKVPVLQAAATGARAVRPCRSRQARARRAVLGRGAGAGACLPAARAPAGPRRDAAAAARAEGAAGARPAA